MRMLCVTDGASLQKRGLLASWYLLRRQASRRHRWQPHLLLPDSEKADCPVEKAGGKACKNEFNP